ncbi:DUF6636 domain-containing protein [Nakamurella lactea]|uniref:DUF6636 domain-containing protein n=1 Tax=Nakamurella lactea TaxID=459515 RepID=UPI00068869AF|nr:DUF6636 domain-containing protein [Nakamurella lactea]
MSHYSRRRPVRFSALICGVAGAALLLAGCASSVTGAAGTQSGQQPPNPPSSAVVGPITDPTSPEQPTSVTTPDQTTADETTADETTGTSTEDQITTAASTAQQTTAAPPTKPPAPPTKPSVVLTTVVHTATVTGAASTDAGPVLALDHFTSPSGNISCLITTDTEPQVRCDLAESSIPKDHDCHGTGDWGVSVTLIAGHKAEMRCISDTVMQPGIPTLAYGQKSQVGPITCTSAEDGMHCADSDGHGFRLAKASYDVS